MRCEYLSIVYNLIVTASNFEHVRNVFGKLQWCLWDFSRTRKLRNSTNDIMWPSPPPSIRWCSYYVSRWNHTDFTYFGYLPNTFISPLRVTSCYTHYFCCKSPTWLLSQVMSQWRIFSEAVDSETLQSRAFF